MVYKKDLETEKNWVRVMNYLKEVSGKRPKDINGVLFLIGIQELGKGPRNFTKEEKQDLMHIAICKILSYGGFYDLEGLDNEGWPHWKMIKPLPRFDLIEQEKLLKMYIIEYFEKEVGLVIN